MRAATPVPAANAGWLADASNAQERARGHSQAWWVVNVTPKLLPQLGARWLARNQGVHKNQPIAIAFKSDTK
jgi:hypothetical protein